jgi:hypothetical protein
MLSSVRARLRRPEYTGENRCWPCTVVNAVVVVVVSGLVGLVSPPVGLVLFIVGAALVALRGYVVPYTPRFAPRVVAALPHAERLFGGDHAHRADGGRRSESLTGDDVDGDALIRRLAEAGVITADETGDLFLSDEVRRTWNAGMERLRDVSDDELAESTASAAPFPASGRMEGDWVVVTREADGGDAEKADATEETMAGDAGDEVWLSRAHAVADTAAVAAMGDRVDRLTAAQAATPFRLFLDQCPVCGGDVEETVARECCGGTVGVYDSPETPILACTDCGEPLYEF